MRSRILGERGRASAILIAVVLVIALALAAWKSAAARAAAARRLTQSLSAAQLQQLARLTETLAD